MPHLTIRTIKGKPYAYLEESIRYGTQVKKISKYLGPYTKTLKIKENSPEYNAEFLAKQAQLQTSHLLNTISHQFPLTTEEIQKLEQMNQQYHNLKSHLHPKDIEDLNKRFIANYVFESNALEGNSLTLKNVGEILFEQRISTGKDLREIYDAQNSYETFLWLKQTKTNINHELIHKIHSQVMQHIDDRLGYRSVPIMLLGKPLTKLSTPETIYEDMTTLLLWYQQHEHSLHPLELAFKFHAQFEKIHPFCDGNGRVGRLLLNYILMKKNYFPIIIRKNSRTQYLKCLEAADIKKYIPLLRFALTNYKKTFRNFFEIYYKYAQKEN